jgi:AbrB family looped-hinge helix DNA binding protein
MDGVGRLVVPKAIREEAGLVPGEPLDVTLRDGRVEIVPAPRQVRISNRDGLRIAEPAGEYETLSEDTVRKTRDRLRDDRKPR